MNQKLKTAWAFTKNLFTTGALMETSRKVELEICRHLPNDKDITVVEYGMGHGNITKEILSRISKGSKVYAFEVKTEFCDYVNDTIKDERLTVINDGAQNVNDYVDAPIHSVIASIPFSFFSKEVGLQIIQDSYNLLESDYYYSQVLYTKFNFKKFEAIFEDCQMIKLPNIPPEYIYHCKKLK